MKYHIGVVYQNTPIRYLMAETSFDEELGTIEHWHPDPAKARLFDTREEAIAKARVTPPGWGSGNLFVQGAFA